MNVKLSNAKGFIRHPVFADPTKTRKDWAWVTQPLDGSVGWYDRAIVDNAELVLPELEKAIQSVIDQVVRRGPHG